MKKIVFILVLFASVFVGMPHSYAQVSVSVAIAPPEIPVYVQPACPYDGYIWTPGYWAYDPVDGYYWVPGLWSAPPIVGFLWTPGYWGFEGGYYRWNRGYWGSHVGFYGGINYGYGYGGVGYLGGRWEGGHFRYNTAVSRVNSRVIHNTYVDRSAVRSGGSRAAFNGPRGVSARPNAQEMAAAKDRHVAPTSRQQSHEVAARKNPNEHYNVNKGHPGSAHAATAHAANAPHAAANRNATQHATAAHHSTAHTQRAPQHHQAVSHQQHAPAQHQAPQQHQAVQQHQQAPRMQQQHAAPQQRMQARPAPQRAPGGGGHEGGGGEGHRR